MSFLSSMPRRTPLAGHWTGKAATSRWCHRCERLHTTRRHAKGEELCPKAPCWGCEHPREEHGELPDETTISAMRCFSARCSCKGFLELVQGPTTPYVHKGLGPKQADPFAGKRP